MKPIDAQISDWFCTVEHEEDHSLSLHLGVNYAKGLRKESAEALILSAETKDKLTLASGCHRGCGKAEDFLTDPNGP